MAKVLNPVLFNNTDHALLIIFFSLFQLICLYNVHTPHRPQNWTFMRISSTWKKVKNEKENKKKEMIVGSGNQNQKQYYLYFALSQ